MLLIIVAESIVLHRTIYEYFIGILIPFYPFLGPVGLPDELISSRE
jgi:hypothetical protein